MQIGYLHQGGLNGKNKSILSGATGVKESIEGLGAYGSVI